MWKDHISKEDAAVISKLKKSGAVILGKNQSPRVCQRSHHRQSAFRRLP
ncbi:MAG TPA: amidase [Candidatus Dorea faecipullorum]|nr:amidase [Candidatus Dorea faecipullorum]